MDIRRNRNQSQKRYGNTFCDVTPNLNLPSNAMIIITFSERVQRSICDRNRSA